MPQLHPCRAHEVKDWPCYSCAIQTSPAKLCATGLRPRLQRLDNERSEELKAFMDDLNIDFQSVPPDDHRRNAAEDLNCPLR
jgi:hypothetical protein